MLNCEPTILTPLARALLDDLSEGVVVFDADGELAYVNRAGRSVVQGIDGGSTRADQLMPKLARLGARISPLWVEGAKVGEAVYLPAAEDDGPRTLAARERQAIIGTLEATGWRLTESARRLGISRTTLWRRLRSYGLERDQRGRWSKPS
ncbi:MAG: helix-turn-helix domain-containing protein [Gemmatimonadales bacterium]|jgi:DNA-binding NtrC family response regulator